jgi:peptidoglycan/LPS O-acetylase OafA/YrhL
LLTRVFGSLSFGELAVDGFFLISGFLITGSWLKNPKLFAYFRKRIARIYPAFVVCSIICVFVVSPLAGSAYSDIRASLPKNGALTAALFPPAVPRAFSGAVVSILNGSAWTIRYEFACYILVALFGLIGVLRRPLFLGFLIAAIYAAHVLVPAAWTFVPHGAAMYLPSIFLVGAIYFIARDTMSFRPSIAIGCTVALLTGLAIGPLAAHASVAVFGGYLILYFADRAGGVFTQINNRNDVSYGVYLYAWPIEQLLLWYFPKTSLLVIGGATLILAYAFGWASWRLIEKPVLERFGRERASAKPPPREAPQVSPNDA